MFENICDALHREVEKLNKKYENGTQMSMADLEDIDLIAHALKNITTYEAMKTSEDSYSRSRGRYRY